MEKIRPQTYATHRRWDPCFHFFALPVLLLVYPAWSIVHLYRHYPAPQSFVYLVFAFALAVAVVHSRLFALRVQDRLIVLEERLRWERALSPEKRALAAQLTDDQVIGARFASDEEVADLVAAACAEKLTRDQIKKRVKSWRPDYRRA
jgi:hypothetical protein